MLPVVITHLASCGLVNGVHSNSINVLLLAFIEHLISSLTHETCVDTQGSHEGKSSKCYMRSHNFLIFYDNYDPVNILYILIYSESNNLFSNLVFSYCW